MSPKKEPNPYEECKIKYTKGRNIKVRNENFGLISGLLFKTFFSISNKAAKRLKIE
tara:strand:- start:225 stop:392 length:168 start_codon:yes stop_codon:yes gene_type:complete